MSIGVHLTRATIEQNRAGFDGQRPSIRHRITSIDAEIHQHLRQFGGITDHRRAAALRSGLNLNRLGKGVLQQPMHFGDELVHPHGTTLALNASREGEQLLDQVGTSVGTRHHRLQQSLVVGGHTSRRQQVSSHQQWCQHVVEIVGNASCQRADAL